MDRPMHSYLLASLLALSRSHSFSSQERVPVWTEGTDAMISSCCACGWLGLGRPAGHGPMAPLPKTNGPRCARVPHGGRVACELCQLLLGVGRCRPSWHVHGYRAMASA